jgi:hypothetical protein
MVAKMHARLKKLIRPPKGETRMGFGEVICSTTNSRSCRRNLVQSILKIGMWKCSGTVSRCVH